MSITGFGARSLIPDELLEGYGYDAATDTYLIRPAIPLGATATGFYGDPWKVQLLVHWGFYLTEGPYLKQQANRILVWQAAYDAVMNGIGRVGETPFPNPAFVFRWRDRGSSGPWNEIPGQYLGVSLNSSETTVTAGNREIIAVHIEDRRLNPSDPDYDAGTTALPVDNDEIEFFLIGPLPPDEQHPIIVDGMTAGEFTVNAYDGYYSARHPETGDVVPTGIRYDEAAVLQMTKPVMFTITKPIDDLRDWLQKHIYQPGGWSPAVDREGRISPVSQVPPADLTTLTTIDNAAAAATPDWNAGQTIINSIRFKYRRYYATDPPDPPPRFDGIPRQEVLAFVEIELVDIEPVSFDRFDEQALEIDALAFGAIGKVLDDADEATWSPLTSFLLRIAGRSGEGVQQLTRPITDQVVLVSGKPVVPVSDSIADEAGFQLFLERREHLLPRYSFGAPTMRLPVRREMAPDERVGDFVWLNLSWQPDYETERRGLVALAQIVALREDSCPWRGFLCEVVRQAAS